MADRADDAVGVNGTVSRARVGVTFLRTPIATKAMVEIHRNSRSSKDT